MKSTNLKRQKSAPDIVYTQKRTCSPVVQQKSNNFASMALKYIAQLLEKQVMQNTSRSTLWQAMRPQKNECVDDTLRLLLVIARAPCRVPMS